MPVLFWVTFVIEDILRSIVETPKLQIPEIHESINQTHQISFILSKLDTLSLALDTFEIRLFCGSLNIVLIASIPKCLT